MGQHRQNYNENLVTSLEEFVDDLCEKIDKLTSHSYTTKTQAAHLQHLKENVPDDNALLILDFAENYQYIIQGEVQSYHWCKEYCSLHPVAIYMQIEGKLVLKSLCVLSDELKHDTIFVHEVTRIAANYCKQHFPVIKKVQYFIDGYAEQYKQHKHCIMFEVIGYNTKRFAD